MAPVGYLEDQFPLGGDLSGASAMWERGYMLKDKGAHAHQLTLNGVSFCGGRLKGGG